MQIYEIWRDVRKDHRIQVNEVINALLELGLSTFTQLPHPMKHALFSHPTAAKELELRVALESKIKRIARQFRSDDKLSVRIPRPLKEMIRSEAQGCHVSMSAVVRPRIISQEASRA
jgi:hypothetical protein